MGHCVIFSGKQGAAPPSRIVPVRLCPWPCDTAAMLYQLSYEATDVGSRSILGSYVPKIDPIPTSVAL